MVGGAKPRMRAGVGTSLLVAAENGLAGLALLQSERAVAMRLRCGSDAPAGARDGASNGFL